ncbi:MAG: hypothetical protein K6G80_04055 [Treponema sp.]|nr:hypothetical protein [Treponema sp.]
MVFCAGFFCAVFWRIILPLVVMLYIAVTVFTGVTLYSVFGVQNDTLAVSVQREGFSVNENFYAAEKPEGMYFNLYTLPSVLLLPLPRVWYVPSAEENGNAVQMARLEQKRFPQVVNRYISWCLSDLNCRYVSFADEERTLVYPALFTCLMERSWELVTIRLHQDL